MSGGATGGVSEGSVVRVGIGLLPLDTTLSTLHTQASGTRFVGCSLNFYYLRFCIRLHFSARTHSALAVNAHSALAVNGQHAVADVLSVGGNPVVEAGPDVSLKKAAERMRKKKQKAKKQKLKLEEKLKLAMQMRQQQEAVEKLEEA
jgi:hypothetical protein